MLGRVKLLLSVMVLCASVAAQAPGDVRVALVIGNAAYAGDMALSNSGNDARAMSRALKNLGFDVIELVDANHDQMRQSVQLLSNKLKGKLGVGVLFYAGHGVQYDWRNYMVPLDIHLKSNTDIPLQTMDVSVVLEAFKVAGNRLNVLVLDACRDNPFDNDLATKGLAPVDAPLGTFMAFATAAGHVAQDGDEKSGNGLYTQYLLQELQKPGSRLEDVFKRVKLQVRQKSAGLQIPWESSNVDEVFSFDKGFSSQAQENEAIRLERYNQEKDRWQQIKNSDKADDFFRFLQAYPNGFISEIAQFRADQLQKIHLKPQLSKDGVQVLQSGANRFALGDSYTLVTTDQITKISKRELQTVTLATDTRVEMNGGATVYDQMGGLIKDDSGVKDPPMLLVPADIAIGKKWRSVFQNRIAGFDARTFINFKVTQRESIVVEGQTHQAYRVEMDGYASVTRGSAQFVGTLWIDPVTMRMVRYDRTIRVLGYLVDASSMIVVDFKAAAKPS